MFTRIAHVCLITTDLQKAIDYYKKLGFSVTFAFTRKGAEFGAYLEFAPGQYIELFEDLSRGAIVNNGIAHFCLQTEEIDAVMRKLDAAGVAYTPKKLGCDGTWQIWLTDPDGNQFEVHQYTAKSTQLTGRGPVEADW